MTVYTCDFYYIEECIMRISAEVWVCFSSMSEPAGLGWSVIYILMPLILQHSTAYKECIECNQPAKCKQWPKSPTPFPAHVRLPTCTSSELWMEQNPGTPTGVLA